MFKWIARGSFWFLGLMSLVSIIDGGVSVYLNWDKLVLFSDIGPWFGTYVKPHLLNMSLYILAANYIDYKWIKDVKA